MSVKYNGKTIAGKYKAQLVDTSNFATKEEIPTDFYTQAEVNTLLEQKANTSDIPNVSNFITMSDVEAKGYLTSVPSEYVTENELSTKGYLTEHQDISNLATKEELATKQDVLTAGENITIENGVISATVPQSGGGEVEINVSAPIVLTGSQKPIENISIDDNGREYLNDKAFWSSIPELVPSIAGEDRNENLNFEDLMNTADRAELRFRKLKGFNGVYPQVNLEGYNSIKRVFSVGDIVMADKITNTVQLCFGKLDDDYTFTPRLICRLQGSSSDFYKHAKMMFLYEPSYTTLNTSSGPWDGNYYMEYGESNSFKIISYKRQNELGGIENIYGIKFIEKDGAYSVAWVNNLGEIIELADSATFDTLDFNLVVFNNYTLELPRADVGIYGFDSTKYFVAKDTIDNVVQRLTDGEAKSISLKYNTDDFIVEEEALRINPEKIPTIAIGAIVPVNASTNYVPNGYLPCDGAEYSKAQFNDLWENYLTGEETTPNVQFYGFYGTGYAGSEFTLYATSTTPVIGQIYELVSGKMVLTSYKIAEVGTNYIRLYSGYYASESNEIIVTATRDETLDVTKDLTTYTNLLNTCSYTEYETEIATYGQCSKFAVDVDNEAFRVPLIKDTETVVTNNVDYANGITLTATPIETVPFTAPFDGVFISSYYTPNQNGYAYINGLKTAIYHADADGTTVTDNYIIPLSKDDVLYWEKSFTFKSGAFYPYKEKTKEKLKSFVVVANGQTNQSLMDWSAWASSLQGKANADLSNCTSPIVSAPYIVETSDKSILPSWYRVWSNGWCEQGSYLETSSTGTVTINLLKDLVNTNYSIQLTESHTATITDARTVNKTNKTTSSFQIFRGTTAIPIYWETKGYIATNNDSGGGSGNIPEPPPV
jgi:hypothetical protein